MNGGLTRLYLKHRKALRKRKQEIRDIIEAANTAYVDRDKAFYQINEIKKLAQKEAKEYESELKELIDQSERPMQDSAMLGSIQNHKRDRDSIYISKEIEKEHVRPKSGKVS